MGALNRLNARPTALALARTAIHRKGPSTPLLFLLQENLIRGRVLDFGCGHGADVAHLMGLQFDAIGWDPHWYPQRPEGLFDTVLCSYVVNVLSETATEEAIRDMQSFIKPDGTGYIIARGDLAASGANVQRDVEHVPGAQRLTFPRLRFRLWSIGAGKA